jgi:hypothetical protein
MPMEDCTRNTPESKPHADSLLPRLEIAGGSVCGREHVRVAKGSQDAFCWTRSERALVAVVSDGCGSGRHSEVGAKLGCRLLVEAVARRLGQGGKVCDAALWRSARSEVLAHLRVLACAMGGGLNQVVSDYFLFTIVGAAVTPGLTALFAIGDGIFAINGEVTHLGPFPNNCPPYLGYGLLAEGDREEDELAPRVLLPTSELDSLLLASDGADALLALPLSDFWTCDSFFANRDAMRRRLAVLNREVVTADWERRRLNRSGGQLDDDTTVVVIRRGAEEPS